MSGMVSRTRRQIVQSSIVVVLLLLNTTFDVRAQAADDVRVQSADDVLGTWTFGQPLRYEEPAGSGMLKDTVVQAELKLEQRGDSIFGSWSWSLPGRPPSTIEMAGVRKGATVELRTPAQQGRVDTPTGSMTFEAVQEYVLTVRGDEISGSIHTYADSDTLEIPSRSIRGRRPTDSDRGRGLGPDDPGPRAG